ncbi:T9SS type A sorting domain-containing protein [Brumimicrobium glaciale]|uniref:T9SS type A sorting domain-containing protein n=1 Tax=Brumimicrobium glaciale TaxID=200475 RepID=A0A4V1WG45_9FLAO|nr:T9SS type A sorting domain-containing protein [Brumimicrobium glaciale]RYM35421.1 T9SS type A sorting domain-containing protein [Brumimicrobium glaciale]
MKNILLSAIMLFAFISLGQQGDGGEPNGYNYFLKTGENIPTYSFDQPNISALRAEDRLNDSLKTGPWRFGYNYSASINFENSAVWYTKANGDKVGILKITSDQAKTINLTFANTKIPEGNELFIYNEDKSFVLGKFTQNHISEGALGAELIPGNTAIVEYFVPAENSGIYGNVEISTITHGYRTANEYQTKILGSSGDCNMNVNCPDGAPYVSIRNSAVMLVVGSNGMCSGALINNTQFDGTPYVLTANHCNSASPSGSWIFRFNWQATDCNNPTSSPSFESLSGSTKRANRFNSDFMLLEITGGLINGTVPQTHSPYFAGWNNGNAAPQSTISIHHPSGDIKKISFDDQPAVATQAMNSPEANSSWRVEWDRNTTTEGGSSGSPLFNQEGKIIGQLWGGNAGCNGTSSSGQDFYGRLFNSWNPTGSSNDEQLKHWLDPTNAGTVSILGYDPYNAPLDYNVAVTDIIGNEGSSCVSSFNPKVEILNLGMLPLTSLTIQYSYNNGATQSVNWTGNLSLYASALVQLPALTQVTGMNTIDVTAINPNGNTDQDMTDNQFDIDFNAAPNGVPLDFEFYLGCYAEEVSWELNSASGTTFYSGSGYTNGNTDNLVDEEFCLMEGCYQLILRDSYGDGVEGAAYNQCNYSGRMTLTNRNSNVVLARLLEADADFGFQKSYGFCTDDVSLNKEELDNKISIYPNPSNGAFKIIMDFEGEKNVVLRNVTGQTIASYQLNENELNISENKLSPGMYIVTITNNERNVTRKIIVE